MKKPFLTLLLLLFISSISFAQGLAVQGIARDNASSAITDEVLNFTFSITQSITTNNTVVLYAEKKAIRTDNFGVFSHIVSTGTAENNNIFSDIDFSIENLKLVVSVLYNNNSDIEVYNQAFQYTPYAHFAKRAANADDGVPTGAIMPFMGVTAPVGWVLCNGDALPTAAAKLIALVGSNAPDLQGMFLRGTGISPKNDKEGPSLGMMQGDVNRSHGHGKGNLNVSDVGSHRHNQEYLNDDNSNNVTSSQRPSFIGDAWYGVPNLISRLIPTEPSGGHGHTISGSTANSGGDETRPVNYGVNYIIKL
jgi:microcystin-dependent protein